MKRISTFSALTAFSILALISTVFASPAATPNDGVTQISGVAVFAAPGECDDPEGAGSDYAVTMTGDLIGCHYTFVEVSRCSPGGAYYESGTETFVGTYNGQTGTFDTSYVFTAVYRNCPVFSGEIAGRCQHPITDGSGTGVFDGVSGRIDMKDNVDEGNFPYRGHITFQDGLISIGDRSSKGSIDGTGTLSGGGC